MKFIYFLYFILFSIYFEKTKTKKSTNNKISKRSKTKTRNKTTFNRLANLKDPISKTFDLQTAKNFRDLAGLGYVDATSAKSQLDEIKKGANKDIKKISSLFKILFEQQKWEHIATKTYGPELDNYCYTVIRNKTYKKIVVSFTGTKTSAQLYHQFKKSNGLPYATGKEYIKIMQYFFEVYNSIKGDLKTIMKGLLPDPQITQVVFVGHSLGGAMANVAMFDFTQENLLPKTKISPVLMTYGQPRAGNYAFANELSKSVAIKFRYMNQYDLVEGIPACYTNADGRCTSEFGKVELNKQFNDYQSIYNTLTEKEKNKFYPFHINGLIYIKGDDDVIDCSDKSEVEKTDACKGEISVNFDFHTIYFGYSISAIGDPVKFPYGSEVVQQTLKGEKVFKHDIKKRLLWSEIEKSYKAMQMFKSVGHYVAKSILLKTGNAHERKK